MNGSKSEERSMTSIKVECPCCDSKATLKRVRRFKCWESIAAPATDLLTCRECGTRYEVTASPTIRAEANGLPQWKVATVVRRVGEKVTGLARHFGGSSYTASARAEVL